MTAGAANLWMPVADVDLAKKFYSEILELPIVKDETNRVALNGRGKRGAGLDGGSAFQPEGNSDGAIAGLKDRGVEFPGEVSDHEWGRVAAFRDPEGSETQLYEPPKN